MEDLIDVLVLGEHNDEDVEDAMLFQILNAGGEAVRDRHALLNLEEMEPDDIKSNFRFSSEDIPRLCHALRLPAEITTNTRNITSGNCLTFVLKF